MPGVEQRIMSLEEASGQRLRIGDVVTPLLGSQDINTVEAIAAATVVPHVDMTTVQFARNRLANEVRPPDFNGPLQNCAAAVTPVDIDQFNKRHHPKGVGRLGPDSVLGLTVAADMYSGGSLVGHVVRSAVYFSRTDVSSYGAVGRELGPRNQVKKGSEIAQILRDQSAARAHLFGEWVARRSIQG